MDFHSPLIAVTVHFVWLTEKYLSSFKIIVLYIEESDSVFDIRRVNIIKLQKRSKISCFHNYLFYAKHLI